MIVFSIVTVSATRCCKSAVDPVPTVDNRHCCPLSLYHVLQVILQVELLTVQLTTDDEVQDGDGQPDGHGPGQPPGLTGAACVVTFHDLDKVPTVSVAVDCVV